MIIFSELPTMERTSLISLYISYLLHAILKEKTTYTKIFSYLEDSSIAYNFYVNTSQIDRLIAKLSEKLNSDKWVINNTEIFLDLNLKFDVQSELIDNKIYSITIKIII